MPDALTYTNHLIWAIFGLSANRLGEHETQRDILERALGIMEAEFGANSHKARRKMAQPGAPLEDLSKHHRGVGWVSVCKCVWLANMGGV